MKTTARNILLCALFTIGLGVPYLQAADVAISALPAGSTLAGTEPIPMVQGAATKKTTPADIKAYMEAGGTVTTSDPVLDLTQTWNAGAVTFTGWKLNITNTASASGSKLLDIQLGGASRLSTTSLGTFIAGKTYVGASAYIESDNGSRISVVPSGASQYGTALISANLIELDNNVELGWAAGSNHSAAADLRLSRDAAGALAQRNSTNAQTLRVYDTYTDASNYGRIALNTNLTSDWVQIAAQTAGTGADNYGIALTPTGTGAISAHVPDSTAAGGNARGASAVDWQTSRSAAAQVASGASSAILGGTGNTASGSYSVASGESNAASAWAATASGSTNTASGSYSWVPGGFRASTRGLTGAYAYASNRRSANGDAQVIGQPVRQTTTDATPVSLATDGTPAAATVMVLPSDSTATCESIVTANSTAAGVVSMAGFRADAIVKNDSSTMTISGGTCTAIGTADAALTTATCALVANGTLDSIEMQVTGVAATTVYWVAEVKCVQAL